MQQGGKNSYTEQIKDLHNNGIRFGQPTHFTHPHLLAPNELAIGVLPNEFMERRQRLIEHVHKACESDRPRLVRFQFSAFILDEFCLNDSMDFALLIIIISRILID